MAAFDGRLLVASLNPNMQSISVFERVSEDWDLRQAGSGAFPVGAEVRDVVLLESGYGALVESEADREQFLLIETPELGLVKHDLGPFDATSLHSDGELILITDSMAEVAIVVLGDEEPRALESPDGYSVRLATDGVMLALPFDPEEPILSASAPFAQWDEYLSGPEYRQRSISLDEFPFLDESCGARFEADQSGQLLLHYTYCDGRVWLSHHGEPWVQAGDMGLGDADSHVVPVMIDGDSAILNTYEGVFEIELR